MTSADAVEQIRAMRAAERAKTPSQQPRHLRAASEKIAADVAAFLARGGRIQKLSHGACSKAVSPGFEELRRQSWIASKERQA